MQVVHAEAVAGEGSASVTDASAATKPQRALRAARQRETVNLFVGSLVLCAFYLFIGSCPLLLPLAYLLFAATCLPYRVHSFISRAWVSWVERPICDFCGCTTACMNQVQSHACPPTMPTCSTFTCWTSAT